MFSTFNGTHGNPAHNRHLMCICWLYVFVCMYILFSEGHISLTIAMYEHYSIPTSTVLGTGFTKIQGAPNLAERWIYD